MSNKLVRNEQRKITSAFLNGVAVAMIAVGGLAQIASMVGSANVGVTVSVFVVICMIGALGLHSLARSALQELEE